MSQLALSFSEYRRLEKNVDYRWRCFSQKTREPTNLHAYGLVYFRDFNLGTNSAWYMYDSCKTKHMRNIVSFAFVCLIVLQHAILFDKLELYTPL